jgi:hypothetical protein
MVLLLAFQRFTVEDWGRPADLNPKGISDANRQDDINYITPGTASPSSVLFASRVATRSSQNRAEKHPQPSQTPHVLENVFRLKVQTFTEKAEPKEFISGASEDFSEFFIFPKDIVHRRYCFTGRGTRLVGASKTANVAQSTITEYVMKVYWPKCTRLNEVEAIQHAHHLSRETRTLAEGHPPKLKYPFIEGHIPEMHGWRDFDQFDTSRIRLTLGLRTTEDLGNELGESNGADTKGEKRETLIHSNANIIVRRSRRVLRVIIFTRYFPITRLEPHQFWTVWEHCYCCEYPSPLHCTCAPPDMPTGHYDLWRGGICHGDISIHNLMVTRDGKTGVLNDFDLVRCAKLQPISRNHDRTGTIPFMALELLTDNYWCGRLEREYRHDQESFIWILPCYFLRSSKGTNPPAKWHTHDWNTCRARKGDFLTYLQSYNPTETAHQAHWMVASLPLLRLKEKLDADTKAARELFYLGESVSLPIKYKNKDHFLDLATLIRDALVRAFRDSVVFASTVTQTGDDEELLHSEGVV